MGKILVLSPVIEDSIRFQAGSLNANRIIREAERVFEENDYSIPRAIEVLNEKMEVLDVRSTEYDFVALQRLVLKTVSCC